MITLAELEVMPNGRGDYLGQPWMETSRMKLNEIRLAWQYLRDDEQRRDVQEGILSIMDHIAYRRCRG